MAYVTNLPPMNDPALAPDGEEIVLVLSPFAIVQGALKEGQWISDGVPLFRPPVGWWPLPVLSIEEPDH
jgi:hypothetical protein